MQEFAFKMLEDETFSTINHFYYRTSKSVMLEITWDQADANKPFFRIESHNGWAILSGSFELHLPDGFYLHCWKTATGLSGMRLSIRTVWRSFCLPLEPPGIRRGLC